MKKQKKITHSYRIFVKGLVQGVGFRPFIYRIASENQIFGTVENNNTGVIIYAEAGEEQLNQFINDIRLKKPPAAIIENINTIITETAYYSDFKIIKSTNVSNDITAVSPDIAVCNDCIDDIANQANRINYPLTNCTNCGPRFTIVKDIPYDRHNTTMKDFEMCDNCFNEYNDVFNRRFHAQPIACNICGPKYRITVNNKTFYEIDEVLSLTADIINFGDTALIKGMGGYFLTCDATISESVNKIRRIKTRESKPFAVMVRNINAAKKYVVLSDMEKELLQSFRSPVVICELKKPYSDFSNQTEAYQTDEYNDLEYSLSEITNGMNSLGIMLPYMPFHYLLFERLKTDMIVFTSGNISDEPILIDDNEAYKIFSDKVDAIVSYNREIYNRADDSVVSFAGSRLNIIRRSRGYTPEPIITNHNTEGIFAAGAELVNTFAIGKSNQAILSQHIGDLKNFETYQFYCESYKRFKRLFKFEPELIACDKHPDYLSARFAKELGLEIIEVQHHYAHMASCMAENNLDERVIGVILDGTGLGDDGNIWGSEFFIGDLSKCERVFHFDYIQLPGGDLSVNEPWRTAYSCLKKYFPDIRFNKMFGRYEDKFELINQMLEKNINTPLSCGAGRLFDAVAAITGICVEADYHAQAPMLLESIADKSISDNYNYIIRNNRIIFKDMFEEMINDMNNNISQKIISGKFHNTIIKVIFEVSMILKTEYNINKVVLSGGVFQNRYLTSGVIDILEKNNFEVYTHRKVPANDGGIALGQLAIVAKRRSENVS